MQFTPVFVIPVKMIEIYVYIFLPSLSVNLYAVMYRMYLYM